MNREKLQIQANRVDYATERIQEAGYVPTYEDGQRIEFLHRGHTVTIWPYSGWFSGKTVHDGRGIHNLLKQLNDTNQ